MMSAGEIMDTRLSLRRLEVFCLVVEEGGVTRAAEHLFVAQPAVSSQLRALEEWLGAKVFVRQGSRLVLTEAGERAYAYAREVLGRSLEIRRDVEGLAAGTGGTVVITSSMAVGTYLLPSAMTRLRAERPGADITLHIAQPQPALHQVEIGEADMAVMTWDEPDVASQMETALLREEPVVLCASPDGPPEVESISVRELPGLPLVGIPRNVAFQHVLELQLRSHGVAELDVMIRLGHAEAMKQAVVDHGWVCFLPRYSVEDDVRRGRLRLIAIPDAALVERISLFHRRDKFFSPLQTAALETIRSHVGGEQPASAE
jgi:DNA-binding transcriptional LysR family regulator